VQGPGLEDLKMKEGRPIRFDVWVAGEPPPLIEWFRNDQRLSNDDFTSISVYAKNSSVYSLKNAVLSIPKVCTPRTPLCTLSKMLSSVYPR
jgi:hypothetical protein